MSRLKSQQSRVLRRRLTVQTLVALLVYTVLFVVLALVTNVTLVPRLANFVADATGNAVRYDPMDYLKSKTAQQLVDEYMRSLDDDGADFSVAWELPEDEMEALREKRLAGEDDPGIAALAIGVDEEDAMATDGSTDTAIVIQSVPKSANSGSDEESVKETLSEMADDDTSGGLPAWTVAELQYQLPNETGYYTDTQFLTLDMLAYQAAWDDFRAMQDTHDDWDVWSEGEGGYAPFVARDLTTYRAVRVLKVPMAILLYLVGCLVIVLWQMQRSLRCFDELSGAVAGLMADRTRPVELPAKLAIAQSELNRIRLEALADERAAAAAEQRKNELVAYLAHDIRTPLTSVIGYLSLLDESPDLPPQQRQRFTHTAFMKAERLESLIEEFFEITRYNLQSIPIERSAVDAQLFLEQIADEFFPQASEKNVRIVVKAPEDQTLFVDGEKLARAVGNVMRNAVAYADAGTTVHVQAQREGKGAHAAGWKITVTDRGREISPEHLESIFEKFYREDGARGAQSGGAGLGLAIAKEIITAHEGTISAESRNGETTFTIAL